LNKRQAEQSRRVSNVISQLRLLLHRNALYTQKTLSDLSLIKEYLQSGCDEARKTFSGPRVYIFLSSDESMNVTEFRVTILMVSRKVINKAHP
jgi:hypothetical protein